MRIRLDGRPAKSVTPKDLILYLIGQIGGSGSLGYAVEFAGEPIASMGMEGRLTVCNMGVALGASFTMIAPDEMTFDYLRGRRLAPQGDRLVRALAKWRALKSDDGAVLDLVPHRMTPLTLRPDRPEIMHLITRSIARLNPKCK